MLPGPPLIVKCPLCHKNKKLMSLMSGNTFGARNWSDTKQVAPMLPRLSPVQRCPHCGGYFMLSAAKTHTSHNPLDRYCSETGSLSYPETVEAFDTLIGGNLTREQQLELRIALVHCYNDAFRGSASHSYDSEDYDGCDERTDEDRRRHRDNLLAAIPLLRQNGPDFTSVIAEFYREAEQFDNCIKTLDEYHPIQPFLQRICADIRRHALDHDSRVFEIK